ncbi:MAG: shikimate kinase [Haloferacaceae archaeon]
MQGRAVALGAGTVLNALATGTGSAFALDIETEATVDLEDSGTVTGEVDGAPDADTTLIETCVALVVEEFGDGQGGRVRTESEVPMAAGLKSSSAAANATVLATLDALGVGVAGANADEEDPDALLDREAACRLGVAAAREAGVTVTGAFDDASASMLGGVTLTNNAEDSLLSRERFEHDALIWTPPEQAFSADADVERCRRIAPVADLVAELATDGRYGEAMTVNGLAYSAALGFPADPAVEALPDVAGVSLSGTGPSVVAVGERTALERVRERWDDRPGVTRLTTTRNDGARIK